MYRMKRKWTREDLIDAVKVSYSIRSVIKALGLVPAGGNYSQINKYIQLYKIDISHFKGKGWNLGFTGIGVPRRTLKEILNIGTYFQSFKLKRRLFKEGLKSERCEECGWAKMSEDGRIPLELDHINGDSKDNRLENLRVLCPNCHSLKPTHRGRNRKIRL